MNTKKITALALAALMAAGSTATSFAVNKVDGPTDTGKDRPLSFNDAAIYEESDGVLKKSNDFRPGDTLYIRLDQMSTTDKKIEDKKDDMKVYADWKVGKDAVESINIVYKKGEAVTSGVQSGAKKYTVSIGGKELTVIPEKTETVAQAIEREIRKAMNEDANFLKAEREADLVAATKADGFVVDGNYAASGYEAKQGGFKVGNIYKDADQAAAYAGTIFTTTGSGTFYLATGATDFGKASFTPGDGYETTAATPASDYQFDRTETTGVVNFVKNSYLNSVTKANLLAMNLVEDVTGEVIVDSTTSEIKNDARVVSAAKPAYVVDSKTYTQVEDAKTAVIDKIAADQATKLSATSRAVIDSSIESVANPGFTYWVEIKTKEDDTTKVLDLAGVLRIGSTKNKAEDTTNAFRLDTSLDNRVYDNGAYVKVVDEWTFKPDSRSVVKFDDDADDVTLYFGENEAAWFEFDARGQSALNLEFTFDFNKEIADLFPKANIDFLTFTSKPATNRTGDLYIVADEDTYLYEVTDNGVKEIPNAEYDEKEGAWHIRTRQLGAYAISDTELDTSVKVNSKDETSSKPNTSKPNGGKNNPDTGR